MFTLTKRLHKGRPEKIIGHKGWLSYDRDGFCIHFFDAENNKDAARFCLKLNREEAEYLHAKLAEYLED